ncbi:hypothetical protein NMG60_11025036 [Bertholletia excelsa]
MQKPRVIEINVRMDCNGCVQKIKKALYGIHGIYDLYMDFPQQKLTIIGWADPEIIMKAIKKTRKIATICSHTESSDPLAQPAEPAPDQQAPPAPPPENPPPENLPPPEAPPTQTTPPPPPQENRPPDPIPPPQETAAGQPAQPSGPKDVEEVHVIYHHPPDCGYGYSCVHSYGGHWYGIPNGPGFRHEPPPPPSAYVAHSYNRCNPSPPIAHRYHTYKPLPPVTHSYNTYKPSPYITEYEYIRSPPHYIHYGGPELYTRDYHSSSSSNNNGNITSVFSDENPNACRIV